MSLLNGKAREVLDFCLSSESPQVRSKVYEIINLSGLEPDDPMFLVLALTGQMRVFLEAAPADLGQLLTEWKAHNAESLSEIYAAISLVQETQQKQAEAIKENLQSVSQKCVSDIKEAGMATTSAIAEANNETLNQVRQLKKQTEDLYDEVIAMRSTIEADKRKNYQVSKSLLDEVEQTTRGFKKVNARIDNSISTVKQLQKNATWLKLADAVASFPALIIVGLFSLGLGWWMSSYMNG